MKHRLDLAAIWSLVFMVVLVAGLANRQIRAATAAPLTICDTPSGSYPTIQNALWDNNCDTVNILPGAHVVSELLVDRAVIIQGAGPGQTILDGDDSARVFSIYGSADAVISDLTIQNGNDSDSGGGINNEATATLKNVRVIDNQSGSGGGYRQFRRHVFDEC